MKGNYITAFVALGVTALALPALALLPTNHNTLQRVPLMGDFAKPSSPPDAVAEVVVGKRAAEMSVREESGPVVRMKAQDGTALPIITATVYDYSTGEIGTYRLPDVAGGEMTRLSAVSSYYGGARYGNLFYACHDGRYADYWDTDSDPHGHKVQAYDIDSWEPVGNEVYFTAYRASDMAIDPLTGTGSAFCDSGSMMYAMYELDLSAGSQVSLASGSTMMPEETSRAMAFSADGVLYGVTKNGKFGKVNMENGVNSGDYNLGLSGDLKHGWTADFDPDTGDFIFIFNGNDASTGNVEKAIVYSINPATGEMRELAEFPGKCITSMFISAEPVEDKAPGTPSAPVPDFQNGSLTGTLSFTMPSELNDGSAASGNAAWTVMDGKETLATGTAAYGTTVNAEVTVSAAGKHNFVVFASNDAGNGKKSRTTGWVGPDIPVAPETVDVSYDEGANQFVVSWAAVTTGVNEGYINTADIRYTVTRLPAGVVVADKTEVLSIVDTYEAQGIENVSYSVVASQGDFNSEPAVSPIVTTGTLALPYAMSEGDSYYARDWGVFDVNNDGSTWESQYGNVRYRYNGANPADDWLISPPIRAYAGCKYIVKLTAYAHGWSRPSSYPERLEVKIGYAATPEAMATTVLESTEIVGISSDPDEFEFDIIPDRDGKFFIGLHAISDADQYYLYVKELTITAPVSTEAPAAVTELAVKADPAGLLHLTGTGRAPSATVNGHSLPAIEKIEVMRDGAVVATVDAPTPGEAFTFSDDAITEEGTKSYTAMAYTGGVAGSLCEPVKTYVGINRPGEVGNITIAPGSGADEIKVSWEPPTKDWEGYPLNGDVTYRVEVYPDNAYYHGNATYEGIDGTSYTLTPEFDGGRDHGFVYVKVNAVNSKGGGYAEKSDNLPVGRALTLPFKESFPNYTLEHPWGDGKSNGPQIASISDDERAMSFQQFNGWNRLMDRSFNSADGAQDGDNGFAGMFGWSYVNDEFGNYHNEWTELLSPRIDLGGDADPMLTFYTYNWLNSNGKDYNEIEVFVECDGQRESLKNIVVGDLGTVQAWEFVAVDLSAYKGKVVNLVFKGTIKAHGDNGYNWILIDNINIAGVPSVDLGIDGVTAPVEAVPGEKFTVKARITNLGTKSVASHKAILYKNGTIAATKDLGSLEFSSSEIVEFEHILGVNDPVSNEFYVVVETEGDSNSGNNATSVAVVGRNLMLLPEPANVRLSEDNPAVMVWDAPDMASALPARFTDDFESYGDVFNTGEFTTDAGEWIFVDVDRAPIGGIVSASTFEMIDFPGIPTHSRQSWWVQSRLFEEFNDDYFGYSGTQYLANMYVVNETFNAAVQQDDWAISPLLCGRQQMISLMARSYDRYTPETIELLWSDGSTDPADFTLARRVDPLPGDWTQIVFVVPDGARRFAIRGCSFAETGTNQTFIDDVAFVPAEGEPMQLELLGYNIYKDNVRLNDAPSTSLSSSIASDSDSHVYSVSAVYDKGESRAVLLGETSLEGIGVDGVTVTVRNGVISITGLDGRAYAVVNAAGVTVSSGLGRASVDVPVATGIYVVRAGDGVEKVVVR